MANFRDLVKRCRDDPYFESVHVSKRPLRGPQVEIVKRVEKIVAAHEGDVVPIRSARQTGKNETGAVIQRRHLHRHQYAHNMRTWIRTAPTYKPQIVNSKKRLRELLRADQKGVIHHPLFQKAQLVREEGYIWRLGNASVEFISSGPQANVVGATASECLDMDEAHKVNKDKFDEDFAPFTANTNAATLLWGVAADGLDTIEWYRQRNIEQGKAHLNLDYPCEIWMDAHPAYRKHVEGRVNMLGWDHPIIKTQYRLIPVSAEGRFLNDAHVRALFSGDHERLHAPRPACRYEALVDIAAGNEDFNPDNFMEGEEDTATDSTIIWIYEVSPLVSPNGLFPIIRLVGLKWITGAALPQQEQEIRDTLAFWQISKCTVDAVGVGRQIAESLEQTFGPSIIHKYTASNQTVSTDCFDLQARLNHRSVTMFRDDGSPEFAEFQRQAGWTKYSSSNGLMKLKKPGAKKHIDMVKGLTYINQNAPVAGMAEICRVESRYDR